MTGGGFDLSKLKKKILVNCPQVEPSESIKSFREVKNYKRQDNHSYLILTRDLVQERKPLYLDLHKLLVLDKSHCLRLV